MSGIYFKGGKVFGVPQESDSDTFLAQNFETALISQFNQVGLILEESSPISGTTSAKLVHDPTVPQFFSEIRTVSEKFRNKGATVVVTAKSEASLGNITILFRDETNNTPIQSSQQISANETVGVFQLGVKIPANCTLFSYTITALPEAGNPVTYIDDITIRSYWTGASNQGQTQNTYESPVITDWVSYIPTFTNFGTVTNANFKWRRLGNTVEVKGTVDVGTPVASVATMTLPFGTVLPSSTPGNYYITGTWGRSASSAGHGGVILAAFGNNHVHFSGASTWSGTASVTLAPSNGTSVISAGETMSIEFSVGINELEVTETKTFISTDLVPAKALTGSMSIDVPILTGWESYTPFTQGFGTISGVEFKWRQVGEDVEIRGKFTAGTVTAVEARVGLPNSLYSAGTSIIPSIQSVGTIAMYSTNGIAVRSALIEPNVNYMTFGNQASGESGLNKLLGNSFQGTGVTVSFTAKIPCLGLSATESKTWSSTQQLVVEESDTEVKATGDGSAAYGSTATFAPRMQLVSIMGDAIAFTGNSIQGNVFTALKSGIYTFNGGASTNSNLVDFGIGFTKNSAGNISINSDPGSLGATRDSVNTATTSFKYLNVSWTGYLEEGDTVRLITSGSTTVNPTASGVYQGRLSLIDTVPDQKMPIPTHELRLEGATTRGTGLESSTIRFDTITKIIGDGFTVNNTNGTIITINKNGILHLATGAYFAAAGGSLVPTLNGNQLMESYCNATFSAVATTTVNVKAGDLVRITSNVNPTAELQNHIQLLLVENNVSVAITNVLPQFEDKDFYLKVTTPTATYGSANTSVLRFTSVQESIGSGCVSFVDSTTLGSSFTILESGLYSLTAVGHSSTNNDAGGINIIKNSTAGGNPSDPVTIAISYDRQNTASVQNRYMNASATAYLQVGDVIRVIAGATILNNGAFFSISKAKSPSVTGVDVTPFINIPQEDTFQTLGLGCTPTSTVAGVDNIPFTVVRNDLNAFNGTVYTVPRNGYLTIEGMYRFSANSASLAAQLFKNGVSYKKIGMEFGTSNYVNFSIREEVKVGETYSIRSSQSGTTANNSDDHWINFVLDTKSDRILTDPETFSSETANLVYSSVYTSSTLANAPIGTFITQRFATVSTNTLTQSTVAPTQSTSDMALNGFRLYGRAYNGTSTDQLPARIQIQIGKGMIGRNVSGYALSGKQNEIDHQFFSDSPNESGITIQYNPTTGILTLDSGTAFNSTSTRYIGTNTGGSGFVSNGYFIVHASKNPALVGMNKLKPVMVEGVCSSAQSIPSGSDVLVVWDAIKIIDTDNALSGGVFTSPKDGYYKVEVNYWIASQPWTAGTYHYGIFFKNNALHSYTPIVGFGTSLTQYTGGSGSEIVYLKQGETFDFRLRHNRSGGNITFDPSFRTNRIMIHKLDY